MRREVPPASTTPSHRRRPGPRTLIGVALVLQLLGFGWEGLWHGLLNPDFERAATVPAMRRHLLTVHIPFYVGIAGLLLATGWALREKIRRGESGLAVPLAFAAAVAQVVGQVWDAWGHLHLGTGGPIAWTLIVLGPLVAAGALLLGPHRQP